MRPGEKNFIMDKNKGEKINNFPMILVILDGWGIAPPSKGNAVTNAKTPFIDSLIKKYPHTELCVYGKCVGLPPEQDGNSEAGHMNIGAGRVVEQDAVRISRDINQGLFFKNPAFVEAIRHVERNKSKLHLMGMMSNGMSAHSDPDHLLALLTLARVYKQKVYLHLFTDGRDSPKYTALKLVKNIEFVLQDNGQVCTIAGRFYAMDRKKKWDRTEKTYNALVSGEGLTAESPYEAITEVYNKGEYDEFIEPYVITYEGKPTPRIGDNDAVIFFNLRSDRARQLTKAFVQKDFNSLNLNSFKRKKVLKNLKFVAMTDFGPDLGEVLGAFPGIDLRATLPMQLSDIKQLYLAETEKYAHVSYFFNGGYSGKVDNEDHYIVPSPDVKSYDETPGMSSADLAKYAIDSLNKKRYDFVVLNFAAPDMIGHTGNLQAAIKTCELMDGYLEKIVKAYLYKKGTVLITADHGNIEEMINLKTGEIDTEHSINKAPFILVSEKLKKIKLNSGVLADIAPTILELMGKEKPQEMTGKSLIKNDTVVKK